MVKGGTAIPAMSLRAEDGGKGGRGGGREANMAENESKEAC